MLLHLIEILKKCLLTASYQYILVEKRGANDCVALITLNRPKALNALSDPLMAEICDALEKIQADKGVSAVVITGSEKAFAAGELSGQLLKCFPICSGQTDLHS